ncbi:MarR family winged helix-turn-helix transcriptional regulator [Arhodomonas sp. SL1]|uniref:MarR family winged helix-turn-helix transcriptional regulator n=1 Tax=Arhodomonas sp. SL1 TaxID=3425691 RepID=UPI003F885C3E
MTLATRRESASHHLLPGSLCTLADGIQAALDRACRTTAGIRLADWRVLAVLEAEGTVSAGAVARRAGMEPPRVTRAITRLRERGLIWRRTDPADHRVARLGLTAAGQECLDTLHGLDSDAPERLLGGLSETQRQAISLLLARLGETAPER